MLIESMEKTLVGYDQWHPQMPASAIRRGTEEAQLLDPASINANSTVLGLAHGAGNRGMAWLGRLAELLSTAMNRAAGGAPMVGLAALGGGTVRAACS
jgi:hypothetical protein